MLNIGDASEISGIKRLDQHRLFHLIAVSAIGLAMLFSACGSDETDDTEAPIDVGVAAGLVGIDGRQIILLEGRLNADCEQTTNYEYLVSYNVARGPTECPEDEREKAPVQFTLTPDADYLLRGAVFVEGGATLTIEAGVHIYGEQATNGTLIIAQGSQIIAEGTASAPIVMTSDAFEGSYARGQWGGLIINGNAPTNQGVTFGEGDTGAFGGDNPTDSSGVLRYVRIEYAGIEFSPDNELNGIAFQGVGSGTVVEHVQVHMNQDDGIEMFGGTVNLKYVLVTGARDDSFDWTDGWTGKAQFLVVQQYGDDADNGFEVDNSSKDNEAQPRSAATIYNATLIGDPSGPESDSGLLIREGAAGTFANLIVTGFNKRGLDINTEASHAQANSGQLVVKNSIFFENREGNFGDEKDDDRFDEAGFAAANDNVETDPNLADPFNKSAPNFTPGTGANVVTPASPPNDGFFEQVDFIGGVNPSNDWTIGWTTSVQQ